MMKVRPLYTDSAKRSDSEFELKPEEVVTPGRQVAKAPIETKQDGTCFDIGRAVSIQILLPVLVVFQLLAVVLVIWGISFANTQKALNSLSLEVQSKTSELISTVSRELLDTAPLCSKLMAGEAELGLIDINAVNSSLSVRALFQHMGFFENALTIYYGTKDGYSQGFDRLPGGKFAYSDVTDSNNLFLDFRDANTTTGLPVGAVYDSIPFDCRTRPWYQDAMTKKRTIWTKLYLFVGPGGFAITGITAATPLFDNNGNPLGVFAVDYSANGLSNFLSSLKVSKHGKAFIVENDGQTVAESKMPDGVQDRYMLADSADEVIRSASIAIVAKYKSFDSIFPSGKTQVSTQFKHNNKPQYLVLRVFNIDTDIKWIIGIVVPKMDILGTIYTNMYITFGIIGAVLLLAIIIALIGTYLIINPLRKLSVQMGKVSRLELDDSTKNPNTSLLYEVKSIQTSFFKMLFALHSFRKYVPDAVIKKALTNSAVAELHMNSEYLTMFFLDIQDFTTLSEALMPTELVTVVGEAMEGMSNVLNDKGACVDKYIGDCIMALFNVPDTLHDHEVKACESALACVEFLKSMHDSWKRRKLPALQCRVGIHCGKALVGNFGSTTRMNFTAIGDSVNLAARLEPLNKYYKTTILISGEMYEKVRSQYCCRVVDVVQVKGRNEETVLLELLSKRSNAPKDMLNLEKCMNDWLIHFKKGNVSTAYDCITNGMSLMKYETDHALNLLRARCEHYLQNPDEFNSTFRFSAKDF